MSTAIQQELWWNLEELVTRAEAAQKRYPKPNPSGSRAWLLLIKNEMVIATISMSAAPSACCFSHPVPARQKFWKTRKSHTLLGQPDAMGLSILDDALRAG